MNPIWSHLWSFSGSVHQRGFDKHGCFQGSKKEMLFLHLDLQGNYSQSDHTNGFSSPMIKVITFLMLCFKHSEWSQWPKYFSQKVQKHGYYFWKENFPTNILPHETSKNFAVYHYRQVYIFQWRIQGGTSNPRPLSVQILSLSSSFQQKFAKQ